MHHSGHFPCIQCIQKAKSLITHHVHRSFTSPPSVAWTASSYIPQAVMSWSMEVGMLDLVEDFRLVFLHRIHVLPLDCDCCPAFEDDLCCTYILARKRSPSTHGKAKRTQNWHLFYNRQLLEKVIVDQSHPKGKFILKMCSAMFLWISYKYTLKRLHKELGQEKTWEKWSC